MTATWQAARNGLPGDSNAVARANHINQFLISHGITPIHSGAALITPSGQVGYGWGGIIWPNLGGVDIDQRFVMPSGKTTIGRVTLPVWPVGNGADVTVSLYTDSGGSVGSLISSVRVPAAWLTQLAAPNGLAAASGPLATAQSNSLFMGDMNQTAFAGAASGTFGAAYPNAVQSGNYIVLAGGYDPLNTSNAVATAVSMNWSGGLSIGNPLPQPSLPQITAEAALVATPDTIVCAGGAANGANVTNVWSAGWNPSTGVVSAWSQQAALPVALYQPGCASSGETVYVVGGYTNTNLSSVYYATVSNGQVTGWNTSAYPIPVALDGPLCFVVNGWLLVVGGATPTSAATTTYYAKINPDGSPGAWLSGPPLPTGLANAFPGCSGSATSSGIVIISGVTYGGTTVPTAQMLTVTADGPAPAWTSQSLNFSYPYNAAGAFDNGDGTWDVFSVGTTSYWSGTAVSVPTISVPLPVTGLTGGGTYHLVFHQNGGDLNDYCALALAPHAQATAANQRPATGGAWSPFTNGYSVLTSVYDLSATGRLLHMWEDSGARISSLIYNSSTSQIMGMCEAVQFADGTWLPSVAQVTYTGATPTGIVQLA